MESRQDGGDPSAKSSPCRGWLGRGRCRDREGWRREDAGRKGRGELPTAEVVVRVRAGATGSGQGSADRDQDGSSVRKTT